MNLRALSRLGAPLLAAVIGVTVGVCGYTFIYAKGAAYLTNDPAACRNCHVMNEQYDGWIKSSHRAVAKCNDCHAPHDIVGKYLTKATNGFRHSFAFTSGRFPEPIYITPHNRQITEHACRNCHLDIVQAIDVMHGEAREVACIHCHEGVGHLP